MRPVKFRYFSDGQWHYIDFEKDNTAVAFEGYEYRKASRLYQFIGKQDKDGNDIYEGDILQLHCGSEDGVFNSHKVKGEVVWRDTGFHVLIPDKTVIANGGSKQGQEVTWREMHSWVGMHTCLTQWQSKMEVVGNTYENAGLLNE